MATKTFLFTGYSLQDADFREVWGSITTTLGRFSKLAYALDPHASDEDLEYWKERGIVIFRLFDVQVFRALRRHLVELGLIPSEALVNFLMRERRRIVQIHLRNQQHSDGAFASAMYQDGLLHQLDDIVDAIGLGTMKREDLENELGSAVNILNKAKKARDIIEIAYWTGRYSAVQAYFEEELSQIPAYFHPYQLRPAPKLIKGSTWNFPPRKKAPLTKSPGTRPHSGLIAVCQDCARELHARQKGSRGQS